MLFGVDWLGVGINNVLDSPGTFLLLRAGDKNTIHAGGCMYRYVMCTGK